MQVVRPAHFAEPSVSPIASSAIAVCDSVDPGRPSFVCFASRIAALDARASPGVAGLAPRFRARGAGRSRRRAGDTFGGHGARLGTGDRTLFEIPWPGGQDGSVPSRHIANGWLLVARAHEGEEDLVDDFGEDAIWGGRPGGEHLVAQ